MIETWAPVPGYEDWYEVSDLGRVRSLDRVVYMFKNDRPLRKLGRILTPHPTLRAGHLVLGLSRDNHRWRVSVHRLVLLAFVGPCPPGMEACHGNGIPTDNRLENLRWDTQSANMLDRVAHGVHHNTRKTHCIHGHEFTAQNTYRPPGKPQIRMCRACRIVVDRRRRARQKEAA